jgi:hypothetical protein
VLQRVKDPERFLAELERPVGTKLRAVTEDDIAADGASFMAFASMMGVRPPTPNDGEGGDAALPSS